MRSKTDASVREQALKLFPWVCARCGREFSGKQLRELTVHHKDHNHHYNPPDGSNWELLCLYCHDAEHQHQESMHTSTDPTEHAPAMYKPFANLKDILEGASQDSDTESTP